MKYICDICNSFEYDVKTGDEKTGLKAGTAYEDISEDWKCPICMANKAHLVPIEVKKPEQVVETLSTSAEANSEKSVSQYRDIAREKLMGNCSVNKT